MTILQRFQGMMSTYLIGVLVICPLLLAMSVILWHGIPDGLPDGDAALLEIGVRAALYGRQLTGPYSRAGFDHPGPLYFYLLAPLYGLTNGRSSSLQFSALLINLLSLTGVLIVIWRNTVRREALWIIVLLSLYLQQTGPPLSSIWNPYVTIAPFVLAVFSFSAVAAGRLSTLPAGIAAASFVMQTHIGYTPTLLAIAGCSVLMGIGTALSQSSERPVRTLHRYRRLWLLCAGLVVLLWSLPFWEEYSHQPGNLTRIAQSFSSSTERLSWQAVIRVASGIFASYFRTIFSGRPFIWDERILETPISWGVAAIVTGQFLALGIAMLRAWRQAQRFWCALAVNCLLCAATILFALRHLGGDIFEYLILWMLSIGMMIWAVIGGVFLMPLLAALARRGGQRARSIGLVAALGMVGAIATPTSRVLWHETRRGLPQYHAEHSYPQTVRRLVVTTLDFLRDHQNKDCLLRAVDRHAWPGLASVALQLDKLGTPPAIDPQWPARYPAQYALSAHQPEGILLFCTPYTADRLQRFMPLQRVVSTDSAVVFWNSLTLALEGTYQFEWLPAFALKYQGFSEPEYNAQQASYRWASAAESAMTVPLETGQDYTMTVRVTIPQKVTSVLVRINERLVTTIMTPQVWDWSEFTVSVPGELVTPLTTFSFRSVFAEPPADFRMHNRQGNSIAFQRITFEK